MMGAESLGKKSVQNASQAAPALERRYLPLDTSFAEKHYRVIPLFMEVGVARMRR